MKGPKILQINFRLAHLCVELICLYYGYICVWSWYLYIMDISVCGVDMSMYLYYGYICVWSWYVYISWWNWARRCQAFWLQYTWDPSTKLISSCARPTHVSNSIYFYHRCHWCYGEKWDYNFYEFVVKLEFLLPHLQPFSVSNPHSVVVKHLCLWHLLLFLLKIPRDGYGTV